jgi:hypothetical protein
MPDPFKEKFPAKVSENIIRRTKERLLPKTTEAAFQRVIQEELQTLETLKASLEVISAKNYLGSLSDFVKLQSYIAKKGIFIGNAEEGGELPDEWKLRSSSIGSRFMGLTLAMRDRNLEALIMVQETYAIISRKLGIATLQHDNLIDGWLGELAIYTVLQKWISEYDLNAEIFKAKPEDDITGIDFKFLRKNLPTLNIDVKIRKAGNRSIIEVVPQKDNRIIIFGNYVHKVDELFDSLTGYPTVDFELGVKGALYDFNKRRWNI